MNVIKLEEVPKKQSKTTMMDIDGFVYYIKKVNAKKVWGVYHYPSGVLLFATLFKDEIERFILKNHARLKELYEEYERESNNQSTSTDKEAV